VDTIDRTVENMNIVCIKHSKYDGRDAPVLSYKTCVAKFVAELRTKNQMKSQSINEWLESKKREIRLRRDR